MDLMSLEYERELLEKVKEATNDEFTLQVNEVKRINGQSYRGLQFLSKDMRSGVAYPVINISKFVNNNIDIDVAVGLILEDIRKIQPIEFEGIKEFVDFEKIKSKICLKLINGVENRDYLRDVLHVDFLDLAIVFYYTVSDIEDAVASITVSNSLAKLWKIDANEMYKIASENMMSSNNWTVTDFKDVIKNVIMAHSSAEAGEEEMLEEFEHSIDLKMIVVSNKLGTYGAGAILLPEVLNNVKELMGGDFVIIPSSIHEVILVEPDYVSPEGIYSMVKEVNETQLTKAEVLSNNVYFYNSTKGSIEFLM